MVKENHVLKLELKQVVKKLKEDPRNVLVWEEQDQADQKKISEQTKKYSFNIKKQETKSLQIPGTLPWTNLFE